MSTIILKIIYLTEVRQFILNNNDEKLSIQVDK